MKFNKYNDVNEFQNDVLDVLLKNEVENNLIISLLTDCSRINCADWFMATVTGSGDEMLLISICTKPFNLLLCKPMGELTDGSVVFFAEKLRELDIKIPGITSTGELAGVFARVYCGDNQKSKLHMTMTIMKLERLSEYEKAPGFCRVLKEDDLSYTPEWERAFSIDCRIPVFPVSEYEERIKTRLGRNIHYIWEDGLPVAQAVWGRNTPNAAAISWVYTPPEHRGKGYATSVVAELSKAILGSGKSFCCLYADAANPVSQGVYRKLGYFEVCSVDEIKFDII
ncbi:MAG: GNAT family N-acetyltransferase [Oscillospiraceae bacterium]|nr:GNAT family N-acetyltransferase [Oscillospiraceae bacterium]